MRNLDQRVLHDFNNDWDLYYKSLGITIPLLIESEFKILKYKEKRIKGSFEKNFFRGKKIRG